MTIAMTMTPIKQHGADDCGVAALAMALQLPYEGAMAALDGMFSEQVETGDRAPGYLGLTLDDMRTALGIERGGPHESGTTPKRGRGLLLVHGETSDGWAETCHWLAWEAAATPKGDVKVTCVNPSDGQSFDLRQIHSKGLRPRVFLYVEGRKGG